jgi:hypothetical protein
MFNTDAAHGDMKKEQFALWIVTGCVIVCESGAVG